MNCCASVCASPRQPSRRWPKKGKIVPKPAWELGWGQSRPRLTPQADMDIQSYMAGVGKQARAASRLVAKADSASKDQALTLTAQAIERDVARLLAANAKDL